MTSDTPLHDLRVVEISDRVAGAYCGKLLRDCGADVVKLEPVAGDPLRRRTIGGAAVAPGADAPLFHYLAGGKRSIAAGPADVRAMLSAADIVILTATRQGADRIGIDVDALLAGNRRSIVVTISNFGWTGPWAEREANEFTLQGWCGATGYRGLPDREPLSVGGEVGEYLGGVFAATAALAVHRRVLDGGPGEHLDLSMLETMTLSMQSAEWLHKQLLQLPTVNRSIEVPSVEEAADGYVGMSMITGQQWLDFTAMVECPDMASMTEFRSQLGRWDKRDFIRDRISPWMKTHTVEEIVRLAGLFRLPMAQIGDGASIPSMDHFAERGVFVTNPAGFRQPRPPWLMSRARSAPPAAAPALGELSAADGRARWSPRAGAPAPGNGDLPLAGLKVVDLTAFWAGPTATFLLASFGADVVKVESIQRPDGIRASGMLRAGVEEWWEYGWVFQAVNTGKKSVTLDLQRPEGRDLLLALVADADVVVENFSPRVMDHFGLTEETLLQANPDVVFVRMPAFGLDGPWRDRVGFAPTMEQLSGMARQTGYPDQPPIAPRGVCDPLAGAHAAFALLAALELRRREGGGQLVEVPMIETTLNATAAHVIEYDAFAATLARNGNRSATACPQDVYACAGDDQWLALSVADDDQWHALVGVLDYPDWAFADGLATGEGRLVRQDAINAELSAWLADQPAAAAAEKLAAAGVPAAVVVRAPDVVENPQLMARGFFETLPHPIIGDLDYPTPPLAPLRGFRTWLSSASPLLGADNEAVLTERCKLSPDDLAALRGSQVIGDRPIGS